MPGRTSSVTVLASRKPSRAQADAWDPILAFAQKKLGAAFICTQGVVYIDQPEAACLAVEEAVARIADARRALRDDTVLIALAVAHGEVTLTEAWRAAHVDEDFEMRAWMRRHVAAARGNGARWRRRRGCFSWSMTSTHREERGGFVHGSGTF